MSTGVLLEATRKSVCCSWLGILCPSEPIEEFCFGACILFSVLDFCFQYVFQIACVITQGSFMYVSIEDCSGLKKLCVLHDVRVFSMFKLVFVEQLLTCYFLTC